MFKNYFLTAFRNFRRNKTFSIINILGLSIGISAALVIFLIVYYEYSFEHYVPQRQRVYRVVLDASFNGVKGHSAAVPAPMGEAMKKEVTGLENVFTLFQFQGDATANVSVVNNNKAEKPVAFKKQNNIVFAATSYFDVVPYQLLAGSGIASLKDPFKVILSESRAHTYFPGTPMNNIIGREIVYNNDLRVTVSGIVKDMDEATMFTAREFISEPTIMATDLKNHFMMTVWNDWMAYTQLFVKLQPGKKKEEIEAQVQQMFKKYNTHPSPNSVLSYRLQPLSDIHFNSDYASFGVRLAARSTLYGLLAVAAFLLVLGCINFINLSTAHASQRAKEIGIRKTMGSSRKQLIIQFLSETLLITAIASVCSIVLTPLLLNVFSDFIPPGLELSLLAQPSLIVFLILLTLLVSFLSGIYPALVLSGYNPVRSLKNQAFTYSGETRNAWIRKSLTVTQFVVAQFFIIGTIVVSKQIHYTLNMDMGFNKEAVITFDLPFDTVKTHSVTLLRDISQVPGVAMASSGFMSPADAGVAFTNIQCKEKEDVKTNVQIRWGDANFLKLYEVPVLAGRNVQIVDSFSEFVINETYAKILGFQRPADALKGHLLFNGKTLPIVGVMKDFHDQSARSEIGAMVFAGGTGNTFHIKLRPGGREGNVWPAAISKIEKLYNQQYPEAAFNYSFVDDKIASLYQSERNTSRLLMWATGLMVTISCLGLLGLVIYTTNRRKKEIGVRKVLGATVPAIVSTLSRDFIKLVVLAFVIAAPAAWWAVHKWLENYVYRTTISWWVFALTAMLIVLFSVITLGFQTIRAAVANPVESLRSE